MKRISKYELKPLVSLLVVAILGGLCLPGCFVHRKRRADLAAAINPGDQPDKILFEKATNEIAHSRFDVGRLTLQTLINTYPDSEYLAKAKLGIADSYYNQGGASGLTESVAEYKDFITFFPTAPEAPNAQYRVGMAHFRMMAKADRDQAEAHLADAEFKEFLLKYPDSPVTIRVKARLRETEEVLAQGEYETASFYLMRGAYRAARGRFQDIADNYPNFSVGDQALFGLGQSLEHLKTPKQAAPYYSRLIRDFPLSPRVPAAKDRLVALGEPVPKSTLAELARAEADASRAHHNSLLEKLSMAMSSSPDTSATLRGPVELGGPVASGVELAKGGLVVPSSPKAAIIAEPVSDSRLSSGRAGDPNAAVSPSPGVRTEETASTSAGSEGAAKPQGENVNSPTKESGSQAETKKTTNPFSLPKQKKKSHFHILKKVVKPF